MGLLKGYFARNLSKLLKDRERKPIELARAVGVNPSTVTRWMKGTITPDLEKLDDIAAFFGEDVTYFDLIAADGPPPAKPKPAPRDVDAILKELASVRGYKLIRDS